MTPGRGQLINGRGRCFLEAGRGRERRRGEGGMSCPLDGRKLGLSVCPEKSITKFTVQYYADHLQKVLSDGFSSNCVMAKPHHDRRLSTFALPCRQKEQHSTCKLLADLSPMTSSWTLLQVKDEMWGLELFSPTPGGSVRLFHHDESHAFGDGVTRSLCKQKGRPSLPPQKSHPSLVTSHL